MTVHQLFINGVYQPSLSGKVAVDENPATGEAYAQVHQAGIDDVAKTLDVAWDSFQSWGKERPSGREAVFLKAASMLVTRTPVNTVAFRVFPITPASD